MITISTNQILRPKNDRKSLKLVWYVKQMERTHLCKWYTTLVQVKLLVIASFHVKLLSPKGC